METLDIEIVQRAKAGDVPAFEALYRLYNDRIFNFARQITNSPEDAGDVVQETFVRAWKSLPGLREDGTFNVWLHRIALNAGKDVLRKRAARPAMSLDDPLQDSSGDTVQLELESGAPGPESITVSGETDAAVRNAVDSLKPEHRLVVTMHHMEDMDVESIAEILNVPKGTVMSRLSRAREILRRKLVPFVEGE